jgi:formate dehydrogenase major subunit
VSDLTRRQLLKLGAAGAGATALSPLANPLGFDLRLAKKTQLAFRIAGAKEVHSVCPYCAVGCGQVVYTRDGELVDIEGNPRSPVNQGTLCPKGSASRQLVQQPGRLTTVRYRAPGATEWQELELETAMDMIAERVISAREAGWQDVDHHGWRVDRTLGFAHLGGATLDNEENYLIKKSFTAMGAVQVENHARI